MGGTVLGLRAPPDHRPHALWAIVRIVLALRLADHRLAANRHGCARGALGECFPSREQVDSSSLDRVPDHGLDHSPGTVLAALTVLADLVWIWWFALQGEVAGGQRSWRGADHAQRGSGGEAGPAVRQHRAIATQLTLVGVVVIQRPQIPAHQLHPRRHDQEGVARPAEVVESSTRGRLVAWAVQGWH